jgi:hypothetical protein
VNVLYIPIPPSSLFIGGVSRPSVATASTPKGPDPSKPWIRVTIQNIARKIPNKATADKFLERVDKALKPWIEDMGEWLYYLSDTSTPTVALKHGFYVQKVEGFSDCDGGVWGLE